MLRLEHVFACTLLRESYAGPLLRMNPHNLSTLCLGSASAHTLRLDPYARPSCTWSPNPDPAASEALRRTLLCLKPH